MTQRYHFKSQDLRKYMIRCFTEWNVPASDAQIATDVLLSADKRGVNSQGIAQLFSNYGSRLRNGEINPVAQMSILRETITTYSIDAAYGLGHPTAYKVMKLVIDKAKDTKIALAAVCNAHHFGIAGYYAMQALPHNMIGFCIAAPASEDVSFTNNVNSSMEGPVAVAIPTQEALPFVLDISGKAFHREGPHSDPGKNGVDSTNRAMTSISGGLGSSFGYLVPILARILAGAASNAADGEEHASPSALGYFMGALRVDAFRESGIFKHEMDELVASLKQSTGDGMEESIIVHSEKEFERAARAEIEGIQLPEALVEIIRKGGEDFGIPFTCPPIKAAKSGH